MKTLYAPVECAEYDLNPFETNMVVADLTCGKMLPACQSIPS